MVKTGELKVKILVDDQEVQTTIGKVRDALIILQADFFIGKFYRFLIDTRGQMVWPDGMADQVTELEHMAANYMRLRSGLEDDDGDENSDR